MRIVNVINVKEPHAPLHTGSHQHRLLIIIFDFESPIHNSPQCVIAIRDILQFSALQYIAVNSSMNVMGSVLCVCHLNAYVVYLLH